MGEPLGIKHLVLATLKESTLEKGVCRLCNLWAPCCQTSEAFCCPAPSWLFFALLIFPAEIERRYILVCSATTTDNACVVLKSHLIHGFIWVVVCFISFPQVPPSCSRACAKAKLIRCVTQLQITLGIRAFLIPLLIPALHNWGSLQICSFLRQDNRGCLERLAHCGAWACLLQLLGPAAEVCC